LKDEHLNKHFVELPNQHLWTLHSLCNALQQDNTKDCAIYLLGFIQLWYVDGQTIS
jgi:hypothetical protein